jgi:alkylhydroperoxidase family enzyme
VDDWTECVLAEGVGALLRFAERLTLEVRSQRPEDVAALRAAGWSDRAIHDAAQVVAYFNYINRVAEGLGIDAEPGLPPWGRARSG